MQRYVAAVDQGTTSTRCILFDQAGRLVSVSQAEHAQHYPRPGWVEHDAAEIWRNVAPGRARGGAAGRRRAGAGRRDRHRQPARDDGGVGARRPAGRWRGRWCGRTPAPADLVRASWPATRGPDRFRDRCGLPLAPYFAGPRLTWLLEHVTGRCASAPSAARCCSGRWRPGWSGTSPAAPTAACTSPTSPTPAARCSWASTRCSGTTRLLGRAAACRARCCPRSGPPARSTARRPPCCPARRSPRRSATSRRRCSARPASPRARPSARTAPAASCCSTPAPTPSARRNGLLTTVAYQLGDEPAHYALEGSIAITGSLVQWFRDGLGLIRSAPEIETLALTVRGQRRLLHRARVRRAVRPALAARRAGSSSA